MLFSGLFWEEYRKIKLFLLKKKSVEKFFLSKKKSFCEKKNLSKKNFGRKNLNKTSLTWKKLQSMKNLRKSTKILTKMKKKKKRKEKKKKVEVYIIEDISIYVKKKWIRCSQYLKTTTGESSII